MKKHLQIALTIGCVAFALNVLAQPRYLSETFTSVVVSSNITYGNNISVLTGTPASIPLLMDVYEPAGDVLTARPLVIVIHSGSFLPAIVNGLALGKRTDSAVVNMCKSLARRGYVAVAMDHRQGWNPVSSQQNVRTGTILNAVYRAVQDAKNCVRFFRNDAATTNTYKIDVSKIAVGGMGSGGYVALAYGSLNKTSELMLTKFIDFTKTPPAPYVDQTLSGNFDGTDATPLNTPNYASYSSNVNVVFSLAGCAGDTSWIEAGEPPVISLHSYKDPFAPYKTANVIVRATQQFVVEASGGYDVVKRSQRLGNQSIFIGSIFNDAYTTKANANSPGMHGLYTFITPAPGPNMSCTGPSADPQIEQSAPWDWWNEPVFIASRNAYCSCSDGTAVNCMNRTENPDMSPTKAMLYSDTIQGFLNPRLVCALGLAGCVSTVGVDELKNNSTLGIYPNPASTEISFTLNSGATITSIKLHDVAGKLIISKDFKNTTSCKIDHLQLRAGLYLASIETSDHKTVTRKIVVE